MEREKKTIRPDNALQIYSYQNQFEIFVLCKYAAVNGLCAKTAEAAPPIII